MLAKSIAKAIGGEFRRVQGNPDILPTDLTGFHIHTIDGKTKFVKGPVFANILMFDELNRTPTRVQSALLQAMAELQVSIDGITYELSKPFHVIATEIPAREEVGIYPLTLTLKDRFWIKCFSSYNPLPEEYEIITESDRFYLIGEVENVNEVMDLTKYLELQRFLNGGVYVSNRVVKYIGDLVHYVRTNSKVALGPSHRGSIQLYRISKALALIYGRDYVIPDDVKELAIPVLAHRFVLKEESRKEEITTESVVREALENVPVPKE